MEKKQNKILNLFLIYIMIQPVVDVFTSLSVRYLEMSLTIGVLIRTLFMVVVAIYALVVLDKKDKIKLFIYYALMAVYMIGFLAVSFVENGASSIIIQMKGLVRTFYLPVVIAALFLLFRKNRYQISHQVFVATLFLYTATIFIARLSGAAFSTYNTGLGVGTVGLYYAANEIGAILCILAPILVIQLLTQKLNWGNVVSLVLLIFAIFEMGTKVPFLGVLGLAFVTIVICIIQYFAKKDKGYLKKGLATIGILVVCIFVVGYTPIGNNMERVYGPIFPKIIQVGEEQTTTNNKPITTFQEFQTESVSGRDEFLKANKEKFFSGSSLDRIFGIGYLTNINGEVKETKLVEMDYFDIFFNQGYLGTIVFFAPIAYIALVTIWNLLKNFKKMILDPEILLMGYSVFISFGIALLAGHVLVAPAVSIYMAVFMILLYFKVEDLKKQKEIVE